MITHTFDFCVSFAIRRIFGLTPSPNLSTLFLERNRPDRSYEERRALSGKFTAKFS